MTQRTDIKTIIAVGLLFVSQSAFSVESARKQISPADHPFSKMVVEVVSVSTVVGNGIVVGEDGCNVLTNFHVAFGKSVDRNGDILLVDRLETGHVVDVGVDLNPRTGTFNRTIRARVVEFANFRPKDLRSRKHDLAMLRLDTCLGREYGLARFEVPEDGVRVPQSQLQTLSLSKTDAKRSALFFQEKCVSESRSAVAGLFFSNCETKPGMSGSPILRADSDGGFTVVGINTGSLPTVEGTEIPFAIFSSVIAPFVQSVIGSSTIRMGQAATPPATSGTVKTAQETSGR